ncbi:electron transport complex subunit RsxE [Clostridium sp. DL1XJH146]
MKEALSRLKNGIFSENAIFVQALGMCPTLAVTSSAENGFGMGMATTVVLIGSNIFVSLVRKLIPDKIRIPAFIVIIASFVTVLQLFMQAYLIDLYKSLGIFIPLIVVNCVILGRAESFASKNGPIASLFDGLGVGLGFTLALTVIGVVREILGAGTFFNMQVMPASYKPILIFVLAPGAFITLGLMLAGLNVYNAKKKKAN